MKRNVVISHTMSTTKTSNLARLASVAAQMVEGHDIISLCNGRHKQRDYKDGWSEDNGIPASTDSLMY